ncbi:MAG: YdjY domain-containing protein [Planctomycetota bacterium]
MKPLPARRKRRGEEEKPAALCLGAVLLLCGCAGTAREPAPTEPEAPRVLEPFEGITVWPDVPVVEIEAWSCLEAGWLEQIACAPGTREHEALVVIKAKPSDVHAALLLAGFQHGAPGNWSYQNESLSFTPPRGDRLDILVRYERDGEAIEEPIRAWMVDAGGRPSFPDTAWVFAGSLFVENPDWMGPGEHYVADQTGSIIGLVTFGDEVVGFEEVFADQQNVQPLAWQVRIDHVPPVGMRVTLILRRAAGSP